MAELNALSRRRRDILHSIVRRYIETGEPVASQVVARRQRQRDAVSPATIRNVMADLSEEGYLSQPHTSAGRVPTERGFESYVHAIIEQKPWQTHYAEVAVGTAGWENIEEGIGLSSRMLMDLTHNMGIAAAIPASAQTLDQIELVPLPDRKVLVVVVTGDRMVRNRIVPIEEELDSDVLASLRNYVNQNFRGWALFDARMELERRLRAESAYYDSLLARLKLLHARGFLEVEFDPEVHIEGASYLIALDLHLTRERMQELLRTLEEKKRIVQLLDRFLEQPAGEVSVHVGLGALHAAMQGLSLIGVNVARPGGMSVKVAVLGPMRMQYEKVMAAVFNVGRTLQNLPA
jgi:heat-inducible transcriptional repressor